MLTIFMEITSTEMGLTCRRFWRLLCKHFPFGQALIHVTRVEGKLKTILHVYQFPLNAHFSIKTLGHKSFAAEFDGRTYTNTQVTVFE